MPVTSLRLLAFWANDRIGLAPRISNRSLNAPFCVSCAGAAASLIAKHLISTAFPVWPDCFVNVTVNNRLVAEYVHVAAETMALRAVLLVMHVESAAAIAVASVANV